jgi:NAD(P)H-dependent flavin oxidoreductase YrpB (nitropropane dioxygenase family)
VALRTALCRRLGIEHPVLSVGFGAGARAELVAAVSNAGGFGVLGASGMYPDAIRADIERTRTLTSRPFGINVIIAEDAAAYADKDQEFIPAQLRAAAEEGAAAVVLFWGDPGPFVEEAHASGLEVLIQVGSVQEAEAAAAAGVDAVIAQGIEAGGHVCGTTSIWELVPMTVAAVSPVPVLASGGIGDGAGLARALTLGAQGVSLGTRFFASDEANIHPEYKRRVVSSVAADTVYTADLYNVWWPSAPHRTLRNRTFEEWHAAGRPPPGMRPGEGTIIGRRRAQSGQIVDWPRYASGLATPDFDGDLDYAPVWAGESCSVVNDIKPAGEIVLELVRDAEAALAEAEQPARALPRSNA